MYNDLTETFLGQALNLDPQLDFQVVFEHENAESLLWLKPTFGIKDDWMVVLVSAPEIHVCRGFWWCDFEPSLLDNEVDIVGLSYGPSALCGAIAQCKGNNRKEHFRRLATAEHVKTLRTQGFQPVYNEINYTASEDNLRSLLEGRPLQLREFASV